MKTIGLVGGTSGRRDAGNSRTKNDGDFVFDADARIDVGAGTRPAGPPSGHQLPGHRRPHQLQRRGDHHQIPFRQPQGLQRVPCRPEGSDGSDQQGQAGGRRDVRPGDQGQERGRCDPEDHDRPGQRIQFQQDPRRGHADRGVHVQDRLDQSALP